MPKINNSSQSSHCPDQRRSVDRRSFLTGSLATGLATCSEVATVSPNDNIKSGSLDDALTLDALGQAELVRRGDIKSIELVDAVIDRIEKLNPHLNAVVTKMYEQARQAATGNVPDGPFQGVPFLLKDLGATYGGVRQTSASKALADFIPEQDSELVVRQKKAGLIIVAKTNTPEFGLTATTEPHLFGPTHNPWNVACTPGGSSGGSAAAVAARIVPMAHANDGGGSIRIPASCCGLFGLKPARARNSPAPLMGSVLACEHAVTLTVRDSAALLDATDGYVPGDPYAAPQKQRPYIEETQLPIERCRIAFTRMEPIDKPLHPDCVSAVEKTVRLLESLGHDVEEAAPEIEIERYKKSFMTLWSARLARGIEDIASMTGDPVSSNLYEPVTWQLYEQGRRWSAQQYLDAENYVMSFGRLFAKFLDEYDFWLTPTLGEPPPKLGVLYPPPDASQPSAAYTVARNFDFVPYTHLANVTGLPAMSVPLHWNDDGLPIGVHFVGRFGDEASLFRLAAQLEQAQPWIARTPSVMAL
ncbi:MAG: amidase [Solibacterales bacterium]|nr:amidase [Bryobacterales bacterium]